MRLGDLKLNCTFQAPSGSPIIWTTIFTCKGAYWPLNGAESIAALANNSTITGKVRIAYRPVRIGTNWRILVNGKILNIASPAINVGGESKYLEFKVKEIA